MVPYLGEGRMILAIVAEEDDEALSFLRVVEPEQG